MENNVKIGGNLLIGIERGSNNNGSYEKFSDGTLICYGQTSPLNSGALTQYGSMYYGNVPCEHTFPIPFVSMPCVTTTIHSNNLTCCIGLYVTATKIQHIGIMSPQTSVDQVYVDYIAIGRWK